MWYVFHVGVSPVEGSIEYRLSERADIRVLFSLDFMQTVKHASVYLQQLVYIPERILDEAIESLARDDRWHRSSQGSNDELGGPND